MSASSNRAEIDLLLALPGERLWAIEVKRSDLKPQRRFAVYPGNETFPIRQDTEAIGLAALAGLLSTA